MDKVSGNNLAVDDIRITLPVAGPEQDIVVSYQGDFVPNGDRIGFNSPVGTPAQVNIQINNRGTDSILHISAYNLTGVNSGDYSVIGPDSILAGDSMDAVVTFTPGAAGTREATLEIVSNDGDEPNYFIDLFGVGGNFASAPTNQASNLQFTDVRSFLMELEFDKNNAEGWIVLRRKGSAVTDMPSNGTVYEKGSGIGNSKVFYVGSDSTFEVREMAAGTDYHYAVFAYNGFGSYISYNTTNPLTGNQVSPDNEIGNYYQGIDTNAATFVSDLTALINNHPVVFYSNFKVVMIDQFLARDTTNGQFVINGEYSGEYKVYAPPFDFVAQDYSREHRFASSWMPTFGTADHTDRYSYADLHNLALVNQSQVNAVRGNEPFGDVVNVSSSFLDSKRGTDANGVTVFEPRDSFKGDVARAVLYEALAYHNVPNDAGFAGPVTESWAWDVLEVPGPIGQPNIILSNYQDIDVLISWHEADPPSKAEMARNDFIYENQENRNPFVDHPDWVCYVDFGPMAKKSCTVGIGEVNWINGELELHPNPNSGNFKISFESSTAGSVNLNLTDIAGKVVYQNTMDAQFGMNNVNVQVDLAAGLYLMEVEMDGASYVQKVKIQ